MLKERLQILMGSEQRKRLETEAKRRNMSVAALIREDLRWKARVPVYGETIEC